MHKPRKVFSYICTLQSLLSGFSAFAAHKMKRKTDSRGKQSSNGLPQAKKRALSNDVAITRFREGLFDQTELEIFTKNYAESVP
jgi:hypothetical protein